MPRFLASRPAGLALILLSAVACPAVAQRPGLPVHHSPAHLPVTGGYLDFGRGGSYAGTGALLVYGARVIHAAGRLQFGAGAARVSPDADFLENGAVLHATLAVQLQEPRPRRAVNLQLGFGVTSLEAEAGGRIRLLDVPLSLAVGSFAPTPVGPAELWAAPRLHLRRTSTSVASADNAETHIGPGLSLGLNFTFARSQLGFDVATEILALKDPAADDWRGLVAGSVSLHLLVAR